MPPHCDSISGPVVKMAKKALETGNVNFILPYVPKESEGEIIAAFKKVLPLHQQPNGAHEIADTFFFETGINSQTARTKSLIPSSLKQSSVCTARAKAHPTLDSNLLV